MPYQHFSSATPPRQTIRIMIVDDHQLLREGLQAVIEKAPDMQLVAIASSGEEAIDKFRATIPDITLMDVRLPGMDGLSAISAICGTARHAKIIALSTYAGEALVRAAQKAGARGYLLKSMLAENMCAAIRSVHAGVQCWPDGHSIDAMRRNKDDLSPREREVIQIAAHGSSNKEIGQRLGISEETVKGYMRSILPKLGASDRTHAVTLSLQRGILNPWDL